MLDICLLTVEDQSPELVYCPIYRDLGDWVFVRKRIVRLQEPKEDTERWVTNLEDWRRVIVPLAAENDLVFCTVDLGIPEKPGEKDDDVRHGLAIVHEVKSKQHPGVRCCILSGKSVGELRGLLQEAVPDVLFDFKGDSQGYRNIVNYIKSQALSQIRTLDYVGADGQLRRILLTEKSGRLRDHYLSKAPYYTDQKTWHIPTMLIGARGLGRRTFMEFMTFLADAELMVLDLAVISMSANRENYLKLETLRAEIEGSTWGAARRQYYIAGLDEYEPEKCADEGENCLTPLRRILKRLVELDPHRARALTTSMTFSISGESRLRIPSRDTRAFLRSLEETIGQMTDFPLHHLGLDENGWTLDHPRILRIPSLEERSHKEELEHGFIGRAIDAHLDLLSRQMAQRVPGYRNEQLTLSAEVRDLLADKTDWPHHDNLGGLVRVLGLAFEQFLLQRASHQYQITRAHLDAVTRDRFELTVLNMDDVRLEMPTANAGKLLVIQNADLYVQSGELLVILGPSGCGKSTILRILSGLIKPTEGTATYRGVPITGPSEKIGLIFQDYSLFPWLTVRKNIEFGPRMRGLKPEVYWQKVEDLLKVAKLEGFQDAYASQLSGGMRQRVAIVRALANSPDVLLMDEPFGALDVQTRWQMQDFLVQTKKLTGTTVVFVTHDIDEAVYVGDRIYIASPRPLRLAAEFLVPFSAEVRKDALRREPLFVSMVNQVREALLAAAAAPA